MISLIVNLVNDLLNLFVWNIDVTLLDSLLQLLGADQPCTILIYSMEFLSQIFDLALVSHLNEHIHSCFFKFTYTFKRL